jgi:hypothetical protein
VDVNHAVLRFAVVTVVIGFPAGGLAQPAVAGTVVVGVQLDPTLPRRVITRGLDEAVRLYQRDGLSIKWTEARNAIEQIRLRLIVLHHDVVRSSKTDAALGIAPREAGRSGRLAYVFFEPIERLAVREGVDVSQVLGAAIAHELGHLLLPNRGHASEGLMRGAWGAPEARAANQGALKFSPTELIQIRSQLTPAPAVTCLDEAGSIGGRSPAALTARHPRPAACGAYATAAAVTSGSEK